MILLSNVATSYSPLAKVRSLLVSKTNRGRILAVSVCLSLSLSHRHRHTHTDTHTLTHHTPGASWGPPHVSWGLLVPPGASRCLPKHSAHESWASWCFLGACWCPACRQGQNINKQKTKKQHKEPQTKHNTVAETPTQTLFFGLSAKGLVLLVCP